MQDEWKPAEWMLASDIVDRLVQVTSDDADLIRDELTKLLRSGEIPGRSAYTGMLVPADHWHGVSLSKTGVAAIPIDAVGLYYARHPIELRLHNVIKCWADQARKILTPEPEPEPPARGLGRPLKRHLLMPAFDRRHGAGERYGDLSKWGRVLAKDVQASENTIRNYLSNHLTDSQKKNL